MIGRIISHYKILEKLGEGGMGVVYGAQDTKLDRTVALKFLPPESMLDADARARFIHEAKAAAALSHPNICTIHEIDESEGQTYIAMECVEGKSLKDKVSAGPLKVEEGLRIALQVAEGLQAAHERGIVHRDIKGANIMVTSRGQAKLMDFGLAKLAGVTKVTKAGTTVGTAAYMSPEQARGEEVDWRTDIWSLGVVLYEMLTGRLPFRGEFEHAVVYSIVNEAPEPVTALRTGLPMELERVVSKCLEKDPAERYQHADELLVDLRHVMKTLEGTKAGTQLGSRGQAQAPAGEYEGVRHAVAAKTGIRRTRWWVWASGVALAAAVIAVVLSRFLGPSTREPVSDRRMIVVLPFENLGPQDDEYFASGITDAITARLAGIRGLGVISRQSAVQYKGSGKSVREMGKELGVDYILEGTVQREQPGDPASRVRIIPQLIRVADDTHIWAATYDQSMTEVFEVQSRVAEEVASELNVALLEPERRALEKKPTDNLEAYEYYLRGKYYWERRSGAAEADPALRMLEKAVELDPGFAEAWAALSSAHMWFHWVWIRGPEALSKAQAAGARALELGPDLPETHLALGYIYYYGDLDYDKALAHFIEAQKRRPNDPEAEEAIGLIFRRQGKWEECLIHLHKALQMNPRSTFLNRELGATYLLLRRYSEAEKHWNRLLSLAPNTPEPYLGNIFAHLAGNGDVKKAEGVLQDAIREVDRKSLSEWLATWGPESSMRILRETVGQLIDPLSLATSGAVSVFDSTYFCLNKAQLNWYRGKRESARAYYDSARVLLETALESPPHPSIVPYLHANLGTAYAGLGRRAEAIQECRTAMESVLVRRDAIDSPYVMLMLAEACAVVGEYDVAVDQLETLLSVPTRVSVALLRLDPLWEPLRDHPRFLALLKKYSGE